MKILREFRAKFVIPEIEGEGIARIFPPLANIERACFGLAQTLFSGEIDRGIEGFSLCRILP
jgi:hypothetical protein